MARRSKDAGIISNQMSMPIENKYNRENREVHGVLVYDFEKGEFSPTHVAKVIADSTQKPYPVARVYYLLRRGEVKAYKKGAAWVILKEDAVALLEKESDLLYSGISRRKFG